MPVVVVTGEVIVARPVAEHVDENPTDTLSVNSVLALVDTIETVRLVLPPAEIRADDTAMTPSWKLEPVLLPMRATVVPPAPPPPPPPPGVLNGPSPELPEPPQPASVTSSSEARTPVIFRMAFSSLKDAIARCGWSAMPSAGTGSPAGIPPDVTRTVRRIFVSLARMGP